MIKLRKTAAIAFLAACVLIGLMACSKSDHPASSDDPGRPTDSTPPKVERKTENLVVVTMDGVRWQDVFRGADSMIAFAEQAGHPKYIAADIQSFKNQFWGKNERERRKQFMPFLWDEIADHGQIHGNETLGNMVQVKNPYWLSYPGYNEIWTGYPDPAIKDNDYGVNPNANVLEYINKQEGFTGEKVIVYDKFVDFLNNILNQGRNNLEMRGLDYTKAHKDDPSMQAVLDHYNTLPLFAFDAPNYMDDILTIAGAKAYLKDGNHPRVLYIATNNMDGYGHDSDYDLYLRDIHNVDVLIGDLWADIQSDPFYKDKTTLIITTDHGRGIGDDWTGHGSTHPHSGEIWFAVMGPDTKAVGEVDKMEQLYQNQFAKSFARFLGMDYSNAKPTGQYIPGIMEF